MPPATPSKPAIKPPSESPSTPTAAKKTARFDKNPGKAWKTATSRTPSRIPVPKPKPKPKAQAIVSSDTEPRLPLPKTVIRSKTAPPSKRSATPTRSEALYAVLSKGVLRRMAAAREKANSSHGSATPADTGRRDSVRDGMDTHHGSKKVEGGKQENTCSCSITPTGLQQLSEPSNGQLTLTKLMRPEEEEDDDDDDAATSEDTIQDDMDTHGETEFSSAVQSLLDDTDTKRHYRTRKHEKGHVVVEMTLRDGGETVLENGSFRIVAWH